MAGRLPEAPQQLPIGFDAVESKAMESRINRALYGGQEVQLLKKCLDVRKGHVMERSKDTPSNPSSHNYRTNHEACDDRLVTNGEVYEND